MIELCTSIDLKDCYRGWCVCGWTTRPYTTIEPAQLDAWQHAFGDRVSDLRIHPEPIIEEEVISVNGTEPKPRDDLQECLFCGWSMRACNLPRHIDSRHPGEVSQNGHPR